MNIINEFLPYHHARIKLTKEEEIENLEYDKQVEKRLKNSYIYMEKWNDKQKLNYFNKLFKDYDLSQIYEWIDTIGLNKAFQITYSWFGDDIQ